MNEVLRVKNVSVELHKNCALTEANVVPRRDHTGLTGRCFSSEHNIASLWHPALSPDSERFGGRCVCARPFQTSLADGGSPDDVVHATFEVWRGLVLAID